MFAKVTASALNVRSVPKASGKILGVLHKDQVIRIEGEEGSWSQLAYMGQTGFVATEYLTFEFETDQLMGKVTASSLNVRPDPSTSNEPITKLDNGVEVSVLKQVEDWYEIALPDSTGFVSAKFIDVSIPDQPSLILVNASNLNVRSGPSTDHEIIGSVDQGTQLIKVSDNNDWIEVRFNDEPGYVHSDFVKPFSGTAKKPRARRTRLINSTSASSTDSALEPDTQLLIEGDKTQKKVARTWNSFGGILQKLSSDFGFEAASAIAVLCVESSGKGFQKSNDNRMIIRFENHKFDGYWGEQNSELFDQHFKYNKKGKKWLGHEWRETTNDEWSRFHGKQRKEWEVFNFARHLDSDAAMMSISMGAPQIMGFHYKRLNYSSVAEMFDQFSTDMAAQIEGLFRFLDKRMIKALVEKDFVEFARWYNGAGQKQKYGGWIMDHYQAFKSLAN